jgi:RNA polymerase sigma factor (TIGR02999 family)
MQTPADVTTLLLRWSEGDEQARDALLPLVYEELRRMAHFRLVRERDDHTLNTTALVHEAYLRLVDADQVQWNGRAHFLALASRMMRRILIDYANRRRTAKRGGGQAHVELDEARLVPDERVEELLELDEALQRLEALYPRPGQAVALCYFGGLTNDEAAAALEISRATVERDLRFARAWLAQALGRRVDLPAQGS